MPRSCYCRASRILFLLSWMLVLAASVQAAEFEKSFHMIPMRDGTRLATDVYLPKDSMGPLPVIFARGPYGRTAALAAAACRRGYAYVSQDMRGRFDSEGSDAVVFHNDGWSARRDGHDSLEWIAKQAWCNGKVATWGGSALGISQNMLAPAAPSVLKAQYVQVAASNMYQHVTFQGGAWRKSLVETWLTANGFDPESLQTYLAHPVYDDFWKELNTEEQAPRINAPAVFWGGWYDIFLQGTLNSFIQVHNRGGEQARGKCRLVVGPYAHGYFDGLTYPENSKSPPAAANDALAFFDHHLKDVANAVKESAAVYYYVMGDPTDANAPGNVWRSADNWPPPAEATNFYLQPNGRLASELPSGEQKSQSYRYDPANPVLTFGGANLFLPKGPLDQRQLEKRPDVLVFSSDVLAEPVEVTGQITAKLFVSSNCPDTDFTVKLMDVYPDGRSMLVTDGILRARFRESFEREVFMEPGNVYELEVDLWSTSLVFNRGHQIRIAVSSSNAPRFEPNPNTGRPFRDGTAMRIATNTIHFSSEHPSSIVLPIYRPTGEAVTAKD